MPPKAKMVAQVIRPPMAIFDFDQTIVKPKDGRPFPKNANDWMWLSPNVPEVIRRFANEGYQIVIVTDQTKAFKLEMIRDVIREIGVVATVVVGMGEDKKPATRMFYEAVGHAPLNDKTFYVGDAAGRRTDWSNVDAEFAKAIGVEFRVPEVVYAYSQEKAATATAAEVVPAVWPGGSEFVIAVGFPGAGKSTYIHNNIMSKGGYSLIEGDVYKTQSKILKAAAAAAATATSAASAKGIVIDATNPTKEVRAKYIAWARNHGYERVRCLWVNTPYEVAVEQNKLRGEAAVPRIALSMFNKRFQEPTLDEGFDEIVRTNKIM